MLNLAGDVESDEVAPGGQQQAENGTRAAVAERVVVESRDGQQARRRGRGEGLIGVEKFVWCDVSGGERQFQSLGQFVDDGLADAAERAVRMGSQNGAADHGEQIGRAGLGEKAVVIEQHGGRLRIIQRGLAVGEVPVQSVTRFDARAERIGRNLSDAGCDEVLAVVEPVEPQFERQRKRVNADCRRASQFAAGGSQVRQVVAGRDEDHDPQVVMERHKLPIVFDNLFDLLPQLVRHEIVRKADGPQRTKQPIEMFIDAKRLVMERPQHLRDGSSEDDSQIGHRQFGFVGVDQLVVEVGNRLGHSEPA